jgi:glutaredoxin
MPHWTIYTRPGCTLCESLMTELAAVLGPVASADVQVIDISDNEDLERRYGVKVPVLTADGDFVCAYRLDRERVAAYLQH